MTKTPDIPKPADVLDVALSRIPGYITADARVARLDRFDDTEVAALKTAILEREKDLKAAVTAIADGEEVDPRDIAREIVDLEAKTIIAEKVTKMAAHLRIAFRQERGDLSKEQKDVALTHLNEMVTVLAAEVVDLDLQLGSARSLEDALGGTSAQLVAWQRLDQLVETLEAIRAAQKHLLARGNPEEANALAGQMTRVGLLADALDHDRHWVNGRMDLVRANYPAPSKYARYFEWLSSWKSPDEVTDRRLCPTRMRLHGGPLRTGTAT